MHASDHATRATIWRWSRSRSWPPGLGAAATHRAAFEAFAAAARLEQTDDDEFSGLRYWVPATRTELICDQSGGKVHSVFTFVAMTEERGAQLDKLFASIAAEVEAELGEPAKVGRDNRPDPSVWSIHRMPGVLIFVAEHDDWLRQYGHAISVTASSWPADAPLPDLGDVAIDWINAESRRRRDRVGTP